MAEDVLIVEDDVDLRSLLACLLEGEGYGVRTAETGREMHDHIRKRQPDLVVLDLKLPDESGLALARQLRGRSDVAIIVLTGSHDRDDLMAALELGVDDFLTKPFDPKELFLRIRNVLTRSRGGGGERRGRVLTFDGWTLDLAACALYGADEKAAALTPGEYNVLAALVRAPGRVLSRDHLLDAVSRGDDAPLPRMIDVYVSQLRKKIEKNPTTPRLIVTVKGRGYRFDGQASAVPV